METAYNFLSLKKKRWNILEDIVIEKIRYTHHTEIPFWCLISAKPTQPNITGNNPVLEGEDLTLACHSNSLSLPEDFRHNESIIEYTWSGAYNGRGENITLTNLTKYDDGKIVTCTAKDQGACDKQAVADSASLKVNCKSVEYFTLFFFKRWNIVFMEYLCLLLAD